jgi:hypothetical protein
MNIEGEKIKELIEHYGNEKGYPKKSHLLLFCEDNELNYIQWGSYSRGTQKLGLKIIHDLINIFPNINLNWFLKNEPNMLLAKEIGEYANEPSDIYNKGISNTDLMNKLKEIQNEVHKIALK